MRMSTRDAIKAELKAAQDIADHADHEDRDLSTEERGKVTAHLEKAKELRSRATDAGAALKELAELGEGIEVLPESGGTKAAPDAFLKREAGKSLGEQFVGSPEFKSLLASVPEGRFGEKSRVQSAPFGVKSLITGVDPASAGSLLSPQNIGIVPGTAPFLQRPLTIRQLFSSGSTTTDAIEYVQVLSTTNNAAPVAEATSSAPIGDGTGGTVLAPAGGVKPESSMTFQKVQTSVKTIAHWIPATKRALSDAAQVRTLIDTFLRYGLEEEFEDQLIAGDGTGENFTGINNTSGIQTQAAPGAGEDVFTVTRRARRKIRIGGRAIPTAYVMNPIDWENVELARDANERFYGAGPFSMMAPTLWGLPVVESEAVAPGTAWCADWRMGVIWDREQASIQVTDSHADFFIRNLVALLCEMRAAMGILRPAAFCKITL